MGAKKRRSRARKKSKVPSRVYEYGLLDPTEGKETIDRQIDLARRYRNQLVELERNRRAVYRQIMSGVPDVAVVQDQIAAIETQIQTERAAVRDRNIAARAHAGDEAARERIRVLAKQAKALREERKRRCSAALKAQPALRERVKLLDSRFYEGMRALRGSSGVFWGTYQLVEEAWEQSRDAAKRDPKFVASDAYNDFARASGRVGVQLQKGADRLPGIAVKELFGADRRIQIEPVDPRAWDSPVRGERRRLSRTVLRLRIGSQGRDPIWGVFPMVMHRPLPPTARIKKAAVKRERIGSRYRWRLLLTCEDASFHGPEAHPYEDRRAAIDIGWRSRRGDAPRFRVGYLVDDAGNEEEITIPRSIVTRLKQADDLQSIRDKRFLSARDWFAAWLKAHDAIVPDWLREATRSLRQWRRITRLIRVIERWRTARFAGDAEAWAYLYGPDREAWYKKERHLYDREASVRKRALGNRRELYRLKAKAVCERIGELLLEHFDLSKIAKNAEPEEAADDKFARMYRVVVSPHEFRDALVLAAAAHGTKIVEKTAKNSTLRCNRCNKQCQWDKAKFLRHTCEHCGTSWDQDANASKNLLSGRYLSNEAAE